MKSGASTLLNMFFIKDTLKLSFLRRRSTCYLLSSKFILTMTFIILVYYLTMDTILYHKIKQRGPYMTKSNYNEIDKSIKLQNDNNENKQRKMYSIFSPLPVKKIMMAESTHYVRSPLAELVEKVFLFSEIFPFMSANVISVLHCILSVVCVRFFISDSLFVRQLGVCLFQFRNFLDSFDGVIYRAHAKKNMYKSHYGSFGYYVDAFSDVFGGICLIGSIGIFLLRNPPPTKRLTKCFKQATDSDSEASLNLVTEGKPVISNSSTSSLLPLLNTNSCNNYKLINGSNAYATNAVVVISIFALGIRLALSGLFWDRSVHAYEDLLDTLAQNSLHEQLQVNVLTSTITVLIMMAWRVMNALSLQDFLLFSIFVDKIWEFIVKSQYIGWFALSILVLLTELHVSEARAILSQAALHTTTVL